MICHLQFSILSPLLYQLIKTNEFDTTSLYFITHSPMLTSDFPQMCSTDNSNFLLPLPIWHWPHCTDMNLLDATDFRSLPSPSLTSTPTPLPLSYYAPSRDYNVLPVSFGTSKSENVRLFVLMQLSNRVIPWADLYS